MFGERINGILRYDMLLVLDKALEVRFPLRTIKYFFKAQLYCITAELHTLWKEDWNGNSNEASNL